MIDVENDPQGREQLLRLGARHTPVVARGKEFIHVGSSLDDVAALIRKSQLLEDGAFTTGDEIARYGAGVIASLEQWWNELADKSCRQTIVSQGVVISVHQLFERWPLFVRSILFRSRLMA